MGLIKVYHLVVSVAEKALETEASPGLSRYTAPVITVG